MQIIILFWLPKRIKAISVYVKRGSQIVLKIETTQFHQCNVNSAVNNKFQIVFLWAMFFVCNKTFVWPGITEEIK